MTRARDGKNDRVFVLSKIFYEDSAPCEDRVVLGVFSDGALAKAQVEGVTWSPMAPDGWVAHPSPGTRPGPRYDILEFELDAPAT